MRNIHTGSLYSAARPRGDSLTCYLHNNFYIASGLIRRQGIVVSTWFLNVGFILLEDIGSLCHALSYHPDFTC